MNTVEPMLVEPKHIVERARDAGLVGAGGAGFPTYLKLSARADTVIANGAECEPLLASDKTLIVREPERVARGLRLAVNAVGAQKGILAVKSDPHPSRFGHDGREGRDDRDGHDGHDLNVFALEHAYPAGDEHLLVKEVTGRVVPQGGIPLNVGTVVMNVSTLAALADAVDGRPFTHRLVTVAGDVRNPTVAQVPVGSHAADLLDMVGGPVSDLFWVLVGGPLMGRLAGPFDVAALREVKRRDGLAADREAPPLVVGKTTGGMVFLAEGHPLVRQRSRPAEQDVRLARSVCCQCSMCTDLCPRRLLGHRLRPHLLMRAVGFGVGLTEDLLQTAWLCSECGVCAFYSCPAGLSPVGVIRWLKQMLAARGARPAPAALVSGAPPEVVVRSRRVPAQRLVARVGLSAEEQRTVKVRDERLEVDCVSVPLAQGWGGTLVPVVAEGDAVVEGALLAAPSADGRGVPAHSPLAGRVTRAGADPVITVRASG